MASTPLSGQFFARLAPARFSTGTKMLLILTVALLPLGLIALFASIQSAQAKRAQREADARVIATAEARQVDILMLRGVGLIRGNLSAATPSSAACNRLLERDRSALGYSTRIALVGADHHLLCATVGFAPPLGATISADGVVASLLPENAGLRFVVPTVSGAYGIIEVPLVLLQQVLATDSSQGIVLTDVRRHMTVSSIGRTSPLMRRVHVSAPVAGGQLVLQLALATNPISAVEVLLVLLPLLMWAAAAIICWVVLDQALVRPLQLMRRAIADYQPGSDPLVLPHLATPAEEIRALGVALESTTGQVVARELELEEGLERQVRLTREVHHRVKNNLQVVASLINLHARGTEGDVAAAYASIQRRVDALAVVHRNHFAELEENRGVALRAIVAELTANLRATAPAKAAHMSITLDILPGFITQDVAVPIAFLVTEIVELAMSCDPSGRVAIALSRGGSNGRAAFSIEASGLTTVACLSDPSHGRFERIINGLARQLRSTLHYDAAIGRFCIDIPVTYDSGSNPVQ
jgi:two-component system, sensor histidine kinase PdtaS